MKSLSEHLHDGLQGAIDAYKHERGLTDKDEVTPEVAAELLGGLASVAAAWYIQMHGSQSRTSWLVYAATVFQDMVEYEDTIKWE